MKKVHEGMAKSIRRMIIPIAALLLAASPLRAQSDGLGRNISLSDTRITLGEAIAEIQAQTPYRFAFNPERIDTGEAVEFSGKTMTLEAALRKLTASGKYDYVVRNDFIALSQKQPAEQPQNGTIGEDKTSAAAESGAAVIVEEVVTETTAVAAVPATVPESAPQAAEVVDNMEAVVDRPPFVALKTNILYDATATINLGVEFRTGKRTSIDVSGNWNPFTFGDNRKWKHVLIQPEFRWWLKESFGGHFFGAHVQYAYYNAGNLPKPFSSNLRDHRFEGWLTGVGVSYGYRWNFTPNWGLEATIGVGYAYMDYDKYECQTCGSKVGSNTKNYFGPTKAGVTLIYTFGKKKKTEPAAPVYVPPVIVETVEEVEQIIVVEEPQPEPIPEPRPTTAERLAESRSFLAPAAQFDDISYQDDPERFIEAHREGSLTVTFRQGAKVVDPTYKDNAATLDNIVSTIREIEGSSDSRIARVVIAGFASPEGTAAVNDRLARERAEAIRNYLTGNSGVRAEQVDLYNGGVDWHGLRKMVAESDMPDRDRVLDIIDNTPVWDAQRNTGRHGELMRLSGGEPYRYMLRNFFPDLRNAAYIRAYYENK